MFPGLAPPSPSFVPRDIMLLGLLMMSVPLHDVVPNVEGSGPGLCLLEADYGDDCEDEDNLEVGHDGLFLFLDYIVS